MLALEAERQQLIDAIRLAHRPAPSRWRAPTRASAAPCPSRRCRPPVPSRMRRADRRPAAAIRGAAPCRRRAGRGADAATRPPSSRRRRPVAAAACRRRRPPPRRRQSGTRPAPPRRRLTVPGAAAHRRRLARRRRGDLLPGARLEHRGHRDAGADHRRRHARDDGRRLAAAAVVADRDRRGDRRARRDPARPRRAGRCARTTSSARAAWIRSSTRAWPRSPSASCAACGRSSRGCAAPTSPRRSRSRPGSACSWRGSLPLETSGAITAGLPRHRGRADSRTRCPAPWSAARSAPTPCPSARPSRSSASPRCVGSAPRCSLIGLESMAVQLVAAGARDRARRRATPCCCDRATDVEPLPGRACARGRGRRRRGGGRRIARLADGRSERPAGLRRARRPGRSRSPSPSRSIAGSRAAPRSSRARIAAAVVGALSIVALVRRQRRRAPQQAVGGGWMLWQTPVFARAGRLRHRRRGPRGDRRGRSSPCCCSSRRPSTARRCATCGPIVGRGRRARRGVGHRHPDRRSWAPRSSIAAIALVALARGARPRADGAPSPASRALTAFLAGLAAPWLWAIGVLVAVAVPIAARAARATRRRSAPSLLALAPVAVGAVAAFIAPAAIGAAFDVAVDARAAFVLLQWVALGRARRAPSPCASTPRAAPRSRSRRTACSLVSLLALLASSPRTEAVRLRGDRRARARDRPHRRAAGPARRRRAARGRGSTRRCPSLGAAALVAPAAACIAIARRSRRSASPRTAGPRSPPRAPRPSSSGSALWSPRARTASPTARCRPTDAAARRRRGSAVVAGRRRPAAYRDARAPVRRRRRAGDGGRGRRRWRRAGGPPLGDARGDRRWASPGHPSPAAGPAPATGEPQRRPRDARRGSRRSPRAPRRLLAWPAFAAATLALWFWLDGSGVVRDRGVRAAARPSGCSCSPRCWSGCAGRSRRRSPWSWRLTLGLVLPALAMRSATARDSPVRGTVVAIVAAALTRWSSRGRRSRRVRIPALAGAVVALVALAIVAVDRAVDDPAGTALAAAAGRRRVRRRRSASCADRASAARRRDHRRRTASLAGRGVVRRRRAADRARGRGAGDVPVARRAARRRGRARHPRRPAPRRGRARTALPLGAATRWTAFAGAIVAAGGALARRRRRRDRARQPAARRGPARRRGPRDVAARPRRTSRGRAASGSRGSPASRSPSRRASSPRRTTRGPGSSSSAALLAAIGCVVAPIADVAGAQDARPRSSSSAGALAMGLRALLASRRRVGRVRRDRGGRGRARSSRRRWCG